MLLKNVVVDESVCFQPATFKEQRKKSTLAFTSVSIGTFGHYGGQHQTSSNAASRSHATLLGMGYSDSESHLIIPR